MFSEINAAWLQTDDDGVGEIPMVLNQLLTKAANGDLQKVGIQNEFFLHIAGCKYR